MPTVPLAISLTTAAQLFLLVSPVRGSEPRPTLPPSHRCRRLSELWDRIITSKAETPSLIPKEMAPAQLLLPSVDMAAARRCQYRRPFSSNLASVQPSTLIASLPVRASGLEGAIERGRGRVPIQTLFHWLFTSQESGEVNKQVLVFNCGAFIALPSSVLECSTPPFFCPSARHSANLSFNSSPLCDSSPFVLPRSAINSPSSSSSIFFPQSLVDSASSRHFFFLVSAPAYKKTRKKSCRKHLMICHYATIDLLFCKWVLVSESVLYLLYFILA